MNKVIHRIIIALSACIIAAFWISRVDAETAVFKLKSREPILSGFSKIGDKISSHEAVINKLRDSAAMLQL